MPPKNPAPAYHIHTFSLFHPLTFSLSHFLTFSLSHFRTFSPSHFRKKRLGIPAPTYNIHTFALSHFRTFSLSHFRKKRPIIPCVRVPCRVQKKPDNPRTLRDRAAYRQMKAAPDGRLSSSSFKSARSLRATPNGSPFRMGAASPTGRQPHAAYSCRRHGGRRSDRW
jgi:hypothetical protein